jgi:hypothetical protein
MENTMTKLQFTSTQLHYMATAASAMESLVEAVNEAMEDYDTTPYYFQSIAGYGKTFKITEALKRTGKYYLPISGAYTMFAFGVDLAVAAYMKSRKNDNSLTPVFIDDCDSLLEGATNQNIFKNILEGKKTYKYSKYIGGLKKQLNPVQIAAIEYFSEDENMGFEVDCSRFKFIIASNKPLPGKDDVAKSKNKLSLQHLHAIRSRCFYYSFDYKSEIMWGWIAHTVLHNNMLPDADEQCKIIILDWMFTNQSLLEESSLRVVNKLYKIMEKYPENYKDRWEVAFLK